MQLDKNFVRTLNPSIASRLRHGDLNIIAARVGLTSLSVRNAVHGATTNEEVIKAAIQVIAEDCKKTEEFLGRIPQDLLAKILAPAD